MLRVFLNDDYITVPSICTDEGSPFEWKIKECLSGVRLSAPKELMEKTKVFPTVFGVLSFIYKEEEEMKNAEQNHCG